MTTIELKKIETELGVVLPDYYKTVMLNYPSDLSGEAPEEYELINYPDKIIDENKTAYEDFWGEKLNKQFLIIGENGCGDYFLLDLKKDNCIYSFFHDNQSFYKISNSLQEYTSMILDGEYEKYWGKEEFKTQDLRI